MIWVVKLRLGLTLWIYLLRLIYWSIVWVVSIEPRWDRELLVLCWLYVSGRLILVLLVFPIFRFFLTLMHRVWRWLLILRSLSHNRVLLVSLDRGRRVHWWHAVLNRGLTDIDGRRIIWVKICKLLLKCRTLDFRNECLWRTLHWVCPYLFQGQPETL